MTSPSALAPAFDHDSPNARAWQVVGIAGLALLLMGIVDLGLAVFPPRIGNTEWEFATISALLNGMPVPTIGAALTAATAFQRGATGRVIGMLVWSVIVTLLLLGAITLYVLDIPVALAAVSEAAPRRMLQSAIAKAGAAFVVYGAFHVYLMVRCARFLRR